MTQEINAHIGSDFDDFLHEEGLYADVNAGAAKKLLALQNHFAFLCVLCVLCG